MVSQEKAIKSGDANNSLDPAAMALEIVESLETAPEQFRGIEDELQSGK